MAARRYREVLCIIEDSIFSQEHETKRHIFETAAVMFARQGFEAVSVRDIAHEVGVVASAFYNHFASKDALLEDMYRFYSANMAKARTDLETLLQMAEVESGRDVLSRMIIHYEPRYARLMGNIIKIAIIRSQIDPKARALVRETYYDDIDGIWRPVLTKLSRLKKAKPLNVEIFIEVYCSMCLASSMRMETVFEIDQSGWRETINQLIGFIAQD